MLTLGCTHSHAPMPFPLLVVALWGDHVFAEVSARRSRWQPVAASQLPAKMPSAAGALRTTQSTRPVAGALPLSPAHRNTHKASLRPAKTSARRASTPGGALPLPHCPTAQDRPEGEALAGGAAGGPSRGQDIRTPGGAAAAGGSCALCELYRRKGATGQAQGQGWQLPGCKAGT